MLRKKLTDLLTTASRQLAIVADSLRRRRASVDEIDRLDAQVKTCLARDLGIPADDIRAMATKDRSAADLLLRRMATLGLDPARTDPMTMRDLQRCCSLCRDKQLCVHELDDKPREPTWPKYCPNEPTLTALSSRDP